MVPTLASVRSARGPAPETRRPRPQVGKAVLTLAQEAALVRVQRLQHDRVSGSDTRHPVSMPMMSLRLV